MVKTVGIGIQNYEDVILGNYFYIDKTNFIKEWWESGDSVTLITRPRRFGKTLNMSMLEQFFSVDYADREDLFTGLSIWKEEEYRTLQGTYPVISLSFANIKEPDYKMTFYRIRQLLMKQYEKYSFLLEGDVLSKTEKAYFEKMTSEMNREDAPMALYQLSDYLYRYYGKKVIILLDEYAASFGFTEEEVFTALDEYGYSDKKEAIKRWYDGFIFGKQRDIYNPWSILNFLDTGKIGAYWANTSSNELVGKLIREGSRRVKTNFEDLLAGKTICCPIDEQIVYNQLDRSEGAIWSLLLASGYLKVVSHESEETVTAGGFPKYELMLTNYEVKRMFQCMVHEWFDEESGAYNDFVDALLAGDIEAMNEYMEGVTGQIFSSFDTGKRPSGSQPERFYHGFVLGLIVDLADRFIITSNRESGFGRYDVMLEPKKKEEDAIILEFKVFNPKRERSLEETVHAALTQIEEKKYETALITKGILPEHIHKYGFAFKGKEVLIG